jgi:hypothetical protein
MNRNRSVSIFFGLFSCFLFLSCQTKLIKTEIPAIIIDDSRILVVPTREIIESNPFAEVSLVLSVNDYDSDCNTHRSIETELLPLKIAKEKARLIKEVKLLSYEIHRDNPEPDDDSQFIFWQSKINRLIEEKSGHLTRRINEIQGTKETLLVDWNEYWWMGCGTVFFKQYVRKDEIETGVSRSNFVRYILLEFQD